MANIPPVGPLNEATLTAQQVVALLDLELYVARWATANRDTSRAYNVLKKIFRTENGELIPIKNWYQCSWCDALLYQAPRLGTSPLIRHTNVCARRPPDYVLPETNLRIADRQAANIPALNPAANLVPAQPNTNQINANPVANDVPVQPIPNDFTANSVANNAPDGDQQLALGPIIIEPFPRPQPSSAVENSPLKSLVGSNLPNQSSDSIVQAADSATTSNSNSLGVMQDTNLAQILSLTSRVGALYGYMPEEDFLGILPSADGQWPSDYFDQAKALSMKRNGIKRPRVVIDRMKETEATPSSKKVVTNENVEPPTESAVAVEAIQTVKGNEADEETQAEKKKKKKKGSETAAEATQLRRTTRQTTNAAKKLVRK